MALCGCGMWGMLQLAAARARNGSKSSISKKKKKSDYAAFKARIERRIWVKDKDDDEFYYDASIDQSGPKARSGVC